MHRLFRRQEGRSHKYGPAEVEAPVLVEHGIVDILKRPDLGSDDYPWEKLAYMTLKHLGPEKDRPEIMSVVAYFAGRISCYEQQGHGARNDVPFSLYRQPGNKEGYSINVGTAYHDPRQIQLVLLTPELSHDVARLMGQIPLGPV